MNTIELIEYYADLLIIQYLGLPRAHDTMATLVNPVIMPMISVQRVFFPNIPLSGTFKFEYDGLQTTTLNWNDTASTIQTALRLLSGLSSVLVTGSLAAQELIISFDGINPPPAKIISIVDNSLEDVASALIVPEITEVDVTLPIAVQNAFNVQTAIGIQLDVLGKYAGVSRTGYSFSGLPIVLSDSDFRSLIRMAIIQNTGGSSLADIQNLIAANFPGQFFVFDHTNMELSYFMSSDVGSQDLAEIFVTEGLLPKPMGVALASLIYLPTIDGLFGFRTYTHPGFNVSPFNNYVSYQMDYPWLSYADTITIV